VFAEKLEYVRHGAGDDRAMIQSGHYYDFALKLQRLELISQSL
jgi:hypothetical protein